MAKVILLHGLEQEEIHKVIRAVKSVLAEPSSVAFAMSTPTNLKWPLEKTVEDIWGDHEYLKLNPPNKMA
jgi:hypothetical protein